jgi:hypothetical protein
MAPNLGKACYFGTDNCFVIRNSNKKRATIFISARELHRFRSSSHLQSPTVVFEDLGSPETVQSTLKSDCMEILPQ